MGYLGDKYNSPKHLASEAAFAREMELRAKRGKARGYYCDGCEAWHRGLRELDKPPARCPSCGRPWDHLRRWTIRMENSPFKDSPRAKEGSQ